MLWLHNLSFSQIGKPQLGNWSPISSIPLVLVIPECWTPPYQEQPKWPRYWPRGGYGPAEKRVMELLVIMDHLRQSLWTAETISQVSKKRCKDYCRWSIKRHRKGVRFQSRGVVWKVWWGLITNGQFLYMAQLGYSSSSLSHTAWRISHQRSAIGQGQPLSPQSNSLSPNQKLVITFYSHYGLS